MGAKVSRKYSRKIKLLESAREHQLAKFEAAKASGDNREKDRLRERIYHVKNLIAELYLR